MRHQLIFLLVLLLVICPAVFSQRIYVFTDGLMASHIHHYGREALYTDTLAYKLFGHTLKKPVANDTLFLSATGEAILWQPVEADSSNRFRSRNFLGNYLYLTYVSEKEVAVLLNIKGNSAVFVNGVLHAGDPYSAG